MITTKRKHLTDTPIPISPSPLPLPSPAAMLLSLSHPHPHPHASKRIMILSQNHHLGSFKACLIRFQYTVSKCYFTEHEGKVP